jgi:hypothetical protein
VGEGVAAGVGVGVGVSVGVACESDVGAAVAGLREIAGARVGDGGLDVLVHAARTTPRRRDAG